MDQNHTESIVPAIRGALARFVPAPTVLVDDSGRPEGAGAAEASTLEIVSSAETAGVAEIAGVAETAGAELVAAIQAYVEQNGGLPRRIAVAGGPNLVVGSTLSVADE